MKSEPIVIERTYNASAEEIWTAITDRDQMKEWYFDLAEFKPEVGFEFTFEGGKDERTYLHLCKISEVIDGKKLIHSWRYDGYEGLSFVMFEIFDENNTTRLRLTHDGLETLPADNPDFARHNFIDGWNYIIGTSLSNFIKGKHA